MNTFEELECYKLARQLRKEVSRFCQTLPNEEKYRLKDQIVRSARSITANIAEGYGRHHHQENIQFCRQSRGSLFELMNQMDTALECEYIDEKYFNDMVEKMKSAIR